MFYIFLICPLSKTKIISSLNARCSSGITTAMHLKYLKPIIAEAKLWLKAQSEISLTCYLENVPLETKEHVKCYCNPLSQLGKSLK